MDAGSSQVCGILGFLASSERRQRARDGCWDMPKASSALKMRILFASRRTSPVVCDGTRDNQKPYAVDVTGGGRSSAISRRMSAKRFLEMATSAIWKVT